MIAARVMTVGAGPLVGADLAGERVAMSLVAAGLPLAARECVDEDEPAVEVALRHALEAWTLVVVLAGAGGAGGELVRRALARLTGARLVLNERLLAALDQASQRRDRPLPRRAERLALVPQGALPWIVASGEPGWLLETAAAAVAVLPSGGEAAALDELVDRHLLPYARERLGGKETVLLRTLRAVGVGAGELEERLAPFLPREGEASVTCLPVDDEVWVRVRARATTAALARETLGRAEAEIAARLGLDCYGRDADTLERVVGALLRERGLSISVAESCTGGLLGHRLTNVPGSSAYFERGVLVYSNRAKQELLGVPEGLLRAHGAVSAECAEAMARAVSDLARTPCGLAITGIAGPDGGSPAKPVGTVFVGLRLADRTRVERFRFAGGRESVKWQSTQMALDMLRRAVLERA
jgi:competence/damage-inducible protein CinA-like protein